MTKARTLADNFAADINGITAGTGITGGGTSGTVTVTNSMATAIDAKGDLVVGTGADTFSRLAVASTAGYLLSVDSAEATGLKWAAPAGGGKVLQVVSGATTSQVDSYSTTYVDTNLTATITPTSATSKILILGQQSFWTANHGDQAGSRARIVRNSTVINQRDNFGSIEAGRTGSNLVAFNFTWGIAYLDTPATTSATTYKTQYGNAVTPVGWASAVNPFGTPAQIILLEIGA